MKRPRIKLVLLTLFGIAASVLAGRLTTVIRINGKIASDDVIVQDGKTYVALGDMAHALNLSLERTNNGFDLVGEDRQSRESKNEIGKKKESNGFGFVVKSVSRAAHHKAKDGEIDSNADATEGHEIYAVHCRLTNGSFITNLQVTGGKDILLTDVDDHTYDCLRRGAEVTLFSDDVCDFVLKFEVPLDFRAEDLHYSVEDTFHSGRFVVSLRK